MIDKFDVTNDRSVARAEALVRAYIEKGEWKGVKAGPKAAHSVKATAKVTRAGWVLAVKAGARIIPGSNRAQCSTFGPQKWNPTRPEKL